MLSIHYPDVLETYMDVATVLGQKVDLAKYAILDQYGGAVVDFDVMPFVSMNQWLPPSPLVVVNDKTDGSVNNDFMYGKCKSLCADLLRMACDKIKHAKEKDLYTDMPCRLVINTTGPRTITAWSRAKNLVVASIVDRWYADQPSQSVVAPELVMMAFHALTWRSASEAPTFDQFAGARAKAERAGWLDPERRRLPQLAVKFFNLIESDREDDEDAPQNAPQNGPQLAVGPPEADEKEWQPEVQPEAQNMPEPFVPEPEAQNVPDLNDEELRAPFTPEGLPEADEELRAPQDAPQLAVDSKDDIESDSKDDSESDSEDDEDAPQNAVGPPEVDEEEWQQEVRSTVIVCLCLHQLPLRLSWHSASTHESRLCVSHCSVLSHVVRALFVMLRFHGPLVILGFAALCFIFSGSCLDGAHRGSIWHHSEK